MSVKVKSKIKKKMGPKEPWKWTPTRLNKLAEDMEMWVECPGNTLLSKFCAQQGVHPSQLRDFKKTNERLSQAIKRVKAKECYLLERSCLYEGFMDNEGKFRRVNTAGAIFLLKNNHRYTDNKDQDRDDTRQILNYITKNYSKNGGGNGTRSA